MLRYRLDDLGPYQFEKLTQSLLKAAAGLTVESWGNRGDWGRASYSAGDLRFPDRKTLSAGPFIFQVKFVEGANAAGSRPGNALLASSSKEIERIVKRIKQGVWSEPKNFIFLSNSLLSAAHREKIRAQFREVMPSAAIHMWGGDDVSDILDQNPKIARAFPQLLSIRDLDKLIHLALTRESQERSGAALEIARELVPVFSPTSSYEQAWKVVQKHHFVVLEGPPEVGKSAIAWMLGLTQAGAGWEAIVCRNPDIFFQTFERNQPQVFIADDAFGRTEYDPARTSKWEADLDLVLHRLDARHWLIWTSRKHILERACERMDAQGKARSFPDPGSVLVDVSELSVEERALILFRHARFAGLEIEAKKLIRKYATKIIYDSEFTPERIRRFVHESLPSLVSGIRSKAMKAEQVSLAIKEALRNPTKQMRITFQKLPPAYKLFLVSFLEISEVDALELIYSRGNIEKVRAIYETYSAVTEHEPFNTVLTHLSEAFVKIREDQFGSTVIDWIHPSYRDLVIDELITDAALRNNFPETRVS